jgi:RNA polymerase sigma factor (TIGR02999 family)
VGERPAPLPLDVPMAAEPSITRLLEAAGRGDPDALSALLPLLYDELHALAHRQRLRQRGPETLNTTALLHEAYVKLARADGAYASREHFFRVAAQAMRQVLVDDARRRLAAKRGGEARDATFEDGAVPDPGRPEEVLALDAALHRLAEMSPRQTQIVELRYFAGFSIPETAEILGTSPATVSRDWAAARAWLQHELAPDDPT